MRCNRPRIVPLHGAALHCTAKQSRTERGNADTICVQAGMQNRKIRECKAAPSEALQPAEEGKYAARSARAGERGRARARAQGPRAGPPHGTRAPGGESVRSKVSLSERSLPCCDRWQAATESSAREAPARAGATVDRDICGPSTRGRGCSSSRPMPAFGEGARHSSALGTSASDLLRSSGHAQGPPPTTAPFETQRARGPEEEFQSSRTSMLAKGGQKGGPSLRSKAAQRGSMGPVSWPLQSTNGVASRRPSAAADAAARTSDTKGPMPGRRRARKYSN
mmetsp:Transcript_62962/g.187680  ORF Transcript_62962/g.187680 Transcript_62962/m.187680 type:complete len:280 (-) Transcript_62962:524-1363(-)